LRLIDASFVWTEPHSKRIKIKLKVQSEVEKAVVLQQACVVEFIVQNKMCLDCHRSEASLTWDSVVQVRQQVEHKRTFLYLEQLILKHNAQERTVRIDPMPEGVDFYFSSKADGARFTSFLDASVPIRFKQSEKLITSDVKSNNATYNYTFSVQIAPICKDDLVVLPSSTASHLGSINRLCLCLNVGSVIRLIDPYSCRFCEISSQAYWQKPFPALVDAQRLTTFVVLDVKRVSMDGSNQKKKRMSAPVEENSDDERDDEDEDEEAEEVKSEKKKRRRKAQSRSTSASARISSKHALCEVEIAREKDFGVNDERFFVLSHLGFVLKPGDQALGYDLTTCNFNHQDDDDVKNHKEVEFPDIMLVRKHYPRNAKINRSWKLRSLAAEEPDKPGYGMGVKGDDGDDGRDMEMFMRDLEEDAEMRGKVNLYKDKTALKKQKQKEKEAVVAAMDESSTQMAVEGPPEIPLEELLDELSIGGGGEESDEDDDGDSDSL
jgi:nonsense-mediated mRNA decay protein 3